MVQKRERDLLQQPQQGRQQDSQERERLHAVIRGRVQGVGFRDATWCEARRLGLGGWVRNRLDGTVEVTAEGPLPALRTLEEFLRTGPPMAMVSGADMFWEKAPGGAPAVGGHGTQLGGPDPFEIR